MRLELDENGVVVDAALLGPLLGVDPAKVQGLMRDGAITSRFEKGQGEDEGRFRVTFWHGVTRLQLTCAEDGTILRRIKDREAR